MTAPVSVKAVLRRGGAVLLGRNDRGEWELLGGRPEPGESWPAALVRELREEAGLTVTIVEQLLDERFEVLPERVVRIVAFRCEEAAGDVPVGSAEHELVRFVPAVELPDLRLPDVYRRAIAAAR